jgi:hypothetical protein
MKSYFLLMILITANTSFAKTLTVPLDAEKFITVSDLQSIKIGFLIFVVTSLLHLIKWVWSFFSGRDKDMGDRLKTVEKTQDQVLSKLDNLTLLIAQVKDGQISETQVIRIMREEQAHEERLRKRN